MQPHAAPCGPHAAPCGAQLTPASPRARTGGPGFESPRPCEASGWIKVAANNFRVLLMDQRGTGLSSPINLRNLAKQGGAKEQAKYLSFFRWGTRRSCLPHARACRPLT